MIIFVDKMALLETKIAKILGILLLVRLGLYIPIPNVNLDVFGKGLNPIFNFTRTLTGSSIVGMGVLGILPYINSSIIIRLLIFIFPSLERLQKEEGALGRQKISQYTRSLTFVWALLLSVAIAFFLIKPVVFDWNFELAITIIACLTAGSMVSMWFAELITRENLGSGFSMIVFINIIGGMPSRFEEFSKKLTENSYLETFITISQGIFIYLFIVFLLVLFQDAYKSINIVSIKQPDANYSEQIPQIGNLRNSYIPIKLNQAGIMPLIFSSTITTLFYYPVQMFVYAYSGMNLIFLQILVTTCSFILNSALVIFFSGFYALLSLNPNDLSQNLTRFNYRIPGIRQGNQTTNYLKIAISRLAFIGGAFIVFLTFFPLLLGGVFQTTLFRNISTILILIGVITDTIAQMRGYLVSLNYEKF